MISEMYSYSHIVGSNITEQEISVWIYIAVSIVSYMLGYIIAYHIHLKNKKETELQIETSFIPRLPCNGRIYLQTSRGVMFEIPERLSVIRIHEGSDSIVHGVHNGYIVSHDDQMGNLQYMCSTGQCGCEPRIDQDVIEESDEDYQESTGSEDETISDEGLVSQATTTVMSIDE
jgi:hypothetical protein